MEPIAFIRRHAPFDRLTRDELTKLERGIETVQFPPGARILEAGGAPSPYVYVIRSGAAQVARAGEVVQLLEEGEPFGERSLLSGEPPPFDVVAEEETLAYRIAGDVFRSLLANPSFAEFFVAGLGPRLSRTRARVPARASDDLLVPAATLVSRPPLVVAGEATVAEAARAMREAGSTSVIVTDEPPGILTAHDLWSRVLAEERSPQTPVRDVMTRPVRSSRADVPVYAALLRMLEEDIHHLPLTDDGRIVGVVSDRDLLRHEARRPFYLLRRVESTQAPDEAEGYADEVVVAVDALFAGGLDPIHIGRVVASLNDALTARLLALAEKALGPPPGAYVWLALGSEGRREQVLLTDQDNALVYQDDGDEAEAYFASLAERVVDGLVGAGFPRCPGGYMATRWRRPLAAWKDLLTEWIETPEPQALLNAVVVLDLRPVHGDLSSAPLQNLLRTASARRFFLSHLARTALAFRPPLSRFRRIRNEGGEVDLKRGGIAPIVSLARVYAFEAGTDAGSTVERLEAAAAAGTLSREGAETLAESFRFLLRLRLREQLRVATAGGVPSNRVRLGELSHLEIRHLKEVFRAVLELQRATALRFDAER